MPIIRKRFKKGIEVTPTDLTAEDLSREGELALDSSDSKLKYRNSTETKEVVNTDEVQELENKTIDASTAGAKGNSITIDSTSSLYNDSAEPVKSLGNNVQDALDAVKVALDGQDNASEIDYTPANGGEWVDPDPTKVDAALDQVASRITTNEADIITAQSSVDNHIFNTTGAHEAIAISNLPSGNLTSINVQDSLVELQLDIDDRALADGGTISNASIETPSRLDVKQDTLANLETYAMTASDGQIVFATDEQKMFQVISNELQPIGGGGSTSFEISQSMHGFSVGNGIYHNGTSWVAAQANDADTLAYHVVVEVPDANTFIAADFGRIEAVAHGYTIGEYYFLSDSVAGQATTTEPSTFSNPLFYVESVDILQIKCLRPEQVGANTTLDQLSDVSASTASEGDVIVYDGASWVSRKQDQQVVSLVAAENIAIRDVLYVNGSGQVGLVDADDDAKVEFMGFARESASVSQSLEVVTSGKLGGFTGLTPGEFVYADAANPGKITQVEPTQANVYIIVVGKAISSTEILVNPDLGVTAEFNSASTADVEVLNNQSTPVSITGLSFDGTSYTAVELIYNIYRTSDSEELSQLGRLRLVHKPKAATWIISDDFAGDDAGVNFSIDASGQIYYTSTEVLGTNYSSTLKVNISELFEV